MNKMTTLVMCAALGCATGGIAADPVRHEKLELAQGAPLKKISGSIKGHETIEYSMAVPANAAIEIGLKGANPSNYFNVTRDGADEAMFVGSRDGNRFRATAPAEGTYKVQVYLMRNAARRNEAASYVLEAGINSPAS